MSARVFIVPAILALVTVGAGGSGLVGSQHALSAASTLGAAERAEESGQVGEERPLEADRPRSCRRPAEQRRSPAELHPEIHELYFFTPGPLRLLAAFNPNGGLAEVFRFAGRVLFKGFERKGSIGVWELADETRIAQLFARHHATAWFREGH